MAVLRGEWVGLESLELSAVMTPYYADDAVTIYHGDCRDLMDIAHPMPRHPHVRIITDPPYGGGKYRTDVAPELDTVRGWLAWAATGAFFGYPETLALWCRDLYLHPSEWVTWWPRNKPPVHFSKLLPRETECIAIFGEVCGATKLRRPRSLDKTNRAIAAQRGLDTESARLGDVWTDSAPGVAFNHHLRQHPNEKPLSLMAKLVTLCSDEGNIVIDPFAGSGTTLVAAKQLGRKAVGIEIDERYCEIAAQRCAQEVLAIA